MINDKRQKNSLSDREIVENVLRNYRFPGAIHFLSCIPSLGYPKFSNLFFRIQIRNEQLLLAKYHFKKCSCLHIMTFRYSIQYTFTSWHSSFRISRFSVSVTDVTKYAPFPMQLMFSTFSNLFWSLHLPSKNGILY